MPLIEVEDPNAATSIDFKMEGPVFDAGIPVPIMVDALGHVQGILDKTYLGLIDRKRLSQEERVRFYLQAQSVSHGSLLANLGIIYSGAQTVLPLFGALGPAGIWEYTKQTYEFLKFVFEAVRRKEAITYTWNSDRSVVHVNTGSQTQTFNGPVFNIGQLAVGNYQGLAHHLEAGKVTDIRLGRRETREIGISIAERDLFEFPSKVEEQAHKVHCEVFDFNKFENAGKLRVFSGGTIPEADYRFQVIGRQDVSSYIEAMLHKQVRATCLQEVAENPISGDRIVRLQVIALET